MHDEFLKRRERATLRPGPAGVLFLLTLGGLSVASAQATPGLQSLALPASADAAFEVRVLLEGSEQSLALAPHSIRGEHFVVRAADRSGALVAVAAPAPATFRGRVAAWPHSRVAGALGPDGLTATILGAPGDESWIIAPVPGDELLHSVRRRNDALPAPLACGALAGGAGGYGPGTTPPGPGIGPPQLSMAELVFDADQRYFEAQGGTTEATIAAIEAIVNTVGLVYEEYVGVTYSLLGGIVRTTPESDPYQDFSGSACGILGVFRNEWNQNHVDIQRDTAHLFTGHAFTQYVGCAYIDTMCNQALSYGVSKHYSNHTAQVNLCSHELGHVWGACHCNQTSCPQYGPADCGIMNSGLSGHSPFFSAATSQHLQAQVAAASCLDAGTPSPAPVLDSLSPSALPILTPGELRLKGGFFDQALFVEIDGELLGLADFNLLDAQTIVCPVPDGDALGPVRVRVLGPGGPSESARFVFVECSPPVLVSEYFSEQLFPETSNTWTWAGPVGMSAQLLLSFQPTTISLGGLEVLADPSVLKTGVLAEPGLDSYSRYISWGLWGLDFWMQVLLFDEGQLIDASPVLYNHVGF